MNGEICRKENCDASRVGRHLDTAQTVRSPVALAYLAELLLDLDELRAQPLDLAPQLACRVRFAAAVLQ